MFSKSVRLSNRLSKLAFIFSINQRKVHIKYKFDNAVTMTISANQNPI